MPDRRKTRTEVIAPAPRESFRRRYDDLEARRAALIARWLASAMSRAAIPPTSAR